MGKRVQLQSLLESLIGSRNVYFQPPETVKLNYPCVIYAKSNEAIKFADNLPYGIETRYKVTVVDVNPDSDLPGRIASLPMCSFERNYTADNLNHDVYNLYY